MQCLVAGAGAPLGLSLGERRALSSLGWVYGSRSLSRFQVCEEPHTFANCAIRKIADRTRLSIRPEAAVDPVAEMILRFH